MSLESTSRFISSASPFSSRFTSSSTSQIISVIIPTFVIHHFITVSLQAQNLPFQQILPTVDLLPTELPHDNGTGPDLSRSIVAHHFIFSFTFYFLFIPCGRLSLLTVSFLLHVKYTLSYRIVYCGSLIQPPFAYRETTL